MKKIFFPFLVVIFLSANALLAHSWDVPSVPSRAFKITPFYSANPEEKGVKVTWTFVKAYAPESPDDHHCIPYDALLTIENETPNDIRNWCVNILSNDMIGETTPYVEGINFDSGFALECFRYDTGTDDFIPAMGSLTIPFKALAYEKIHTPKHIGFNAPEPFMPSKDKNFSPYQNLP